MIGQTQVKSPGFLAESEVASSCSSVRLMLLAPPRSMPVMLQRVFYHPPVKHLVSWVFVHVLQMPSVSTDALSTRASLHPMVYSSQVNVGPWIGSFVQAVQMLRAIQRACRRVGKSRGSLNSTSYTVTKDLMDAIGWSRQRE